MTKNALRGIAAIALIAILFNLIAFVISMDKPPVFWIGYGFGMLAILFQLYILRTSMSGNAISRLYGFPVLRVGLIYLVVQFILSIIEMAVAPQLSVRLVVFINGIILIAALLGCITLTAVREEVVNQDASNKKNVSAIHELQVNIAALAEECKNEELSKVMRKISEELRYSDPVSSEKTIDLEKELDEQIRELQQVLRDDNMDDANALCKQLSQTLAERNRICKINK